MSREDEMVTISPNVWCDPEIVDIVKALNDGGVQTIASCSGHGERMGSISLTDGRNLIICHDLELHNEIIKSYGKRGSMIGPN